MANYFTITASFFGNQQVIDHLKALMEHFKSLCGLSQVDCEEDWLPLIFSNETLEQLGDNYYLSVFSEGYDPHEKDVPDLDGWEIDDEEDGVITLFARGRNEPGLDLCRRMCEALGLGCHFRSTDECDEERYDELIYPTPNPNGSMTLRPLSELGMDDHN